MLLNDICDYLTSASAGGLVQMASTSGATSPNLAAGRRPSTPRSVVTLYEIGGLEPVHAMTASPGQAVVERPGLQVVSRSSDYETARLLAHRAWMLIDGFPDRLINGVRYKYGKCRQSPFSMGFDTQNDDPLVAFNADLVKVLSTTST